MSCLRDKLVVLVDDDDGLRTLTRMILERSGGCRVIAFESGDQMLVSLKEVPDLFLIDYMMPGRNGLETIQALRAREHWAEVPAFLITARIMRHEVTTYTEQGVDGIIAKPFDPMGLVGQICGMLDEV